MSGDDVCAACGRPRIPDHDSRAEGPTVRHPFRPLLSNAADDLEALASAPLVPEPTPKLPPWPVASTALLVLTPAGKVFDSFPPGHVEAAEMTARAVGGLIVGVPVLADYRDEVDR